MELCEGLQERKKGQRPGHCKSRLPKAETARAWTTRGTGKRVLIKPKGRKATALRGCGHHLRKQSGERSGRTVTGGLREVLGRVTGGVTVNKTTGGGGKMEKAGDGCRACLKKAGRVKLTPSHGDATEKEKRGPRVRDGNYLRSTGTGGSSSNKTDRTATGRYENPSDGIKEGGGAAQYPFRRGCPSLIGEEILKKAGAEAEPGLKKG